MWGLSLSVTQCWCGSHWDIHGHRQCSGTGTERGSGRHCWDRLQDAKAEDEDGADCGMYGKYISKQSTPVPYCISKWSTPLVKVSFPNIAHLCSKLLVSYLPNVISTACTCRNSTSLLTMLYWSHWRVVTLKSFLQTSALPSQNWNGGTLKPTKLVMNHSSRYRDIHSTTLEVPIL